MKRRLAPLLEGMEMGKSEHDWLEQRLESMTAKEELLFRGAMQIESPRDIQSTIQILQGLDHYQLLYGAEDDVLLGRFVMDHIHTPTHAARGYLDPEIVGAAYRYPLTEEDRSILRAKMNDYCMEQTGMSLDDYRAQYLDEEMCSSSFPDGQTM